MKRYITNDVINEANEIIAKCFDYNAMVDNCSYCLQADMGFNNVGDVVHKHWAHWFVSDSAADLLSDILIRNNARPVRRDIKGYTKNYATVVEVFDDIIGALEDLRASVADFIDMCDYDNTNRSVSIEAEDMLINIVNKLRETNTLADTIRHYQEDGKAYKLEKDIYKLAGVDD